MGVRSNLPLYARSTCLCSPCTDQLLYKASLSWMAFTKLTRAQTTYAIHNFMMYHMILACLYHACISIKRRGFSTLVFITICDHNYVATFFHWILECVGLLLSSQWFQLAPSSFQGSVQDAFDSLLAKSLRTLPVCQHKIYDLAVLKAYGIKLNVIINKILFLIRHTSTIISNTIIWKLCIVCDVFFKVECIRFDLKSTDHHQNHNQTAIIIFKLCAEGGTHRGCTRVLTYLEHSIQTRDCRISLLQQKVLISWSIDFNPRIHFKSH